MLSGQGVFSYAVCDLLIALSLKIDESTPIKDIILENVFLGFRTIPKLTSHTSLFLETVEVID